AGAAAPAAEAAKGAKAPEAKAEAKPAAKKK
ncbi:50S ribosomal protein L25, partial [Candidatus Micrarchaeota archaeon]|nr:50S ribosomal protein L25 [Candidatus Micrarchaeota archaeon]